MCLWGTDNPNFSSPQPHHCAMHITDDTKEIRGHGSTFYLSQWHCLVYREEIILAFLWSNLFSFCFNTLGFKVLRYVAANLRSSEIGYDQLQCVPLHLCFLPLHLCFLNFLPNFLPQPEFHKCSDQKKELGSFPPALGFWMFSQLSASWHLLQDHFLAPHVCKYMVSCSNAWDIKIVRVLKRQKPSCMSLGEDLCDSTSKCGNSSSDPARFAQDTGWALLHSLKHSTADNSQGNCTDSW